MTWIPHLTVAAIVERDGKFLMVEEAIQGQQVYNQPAGHVEANETLIDAVVRETLEETAWDFQPEYFIGLYRMHVNASDTTYFRACFSGECHQFHANRPLDETITATHWLTYEVLRANHHRLRSPLVLRCLEDYLAGQRLPLTTLVDIGNV